MKVRAVTREHGGLAHDSPYSVASLRAAIPPSFAPGQPLPFLRGARRLPAPQACRYQQLVEVWELGDNGRLRSFFVEFTNKRVKINTSITRAMLTAQRHAAAAEARISHTGHAKGGKKDDRGFSLPCC
jgi:hypothetical protein